MLQREARPSTPATGLGAPGYVEGMLDFEQMLPCCAARPGCGVVQQDVLWGIK